MSKTKVNWGIIGCAGIAKKAVIPGILSADNAVLYALSSRGKGAKLDEFSKEFEPVKSYTSYEEMLDDSEIDAIYIPLPNGLHYEWAIKALEKKKHVLCEKPLGVNAKQVQEMKETADKNGVLIMEAFAYRHSPLTKKVKSLIEEGKVGTLKFIESHFSFFLQNREDVRYNEKLSGGATYDVGCYNINVIRYLAGMEPTAIHAIGEIGEESKVDESSCIIMEFEKGLKAFSYCAFNSTRRFGYKITGETGVIEVLESFNAQGETKITITNQAGQEEIIITCPDNYMLEVEQFGRAILDGEKQGITFEDSLGNAKVIDEALSQIFSKRK